MVSMNDVFRVSMVVGSGDEALAELEGDHGFTIGEPMQVPAGVLARAAGVGLVGLPGLRFVTSGQGWRLVGDEVSR